MSTSANAGKGSGISHEALNAASRLLSSPPSGMPPEEWFTGIAPQLFALLEGEGEPEMDRAAAFVIGFGILGRKQYGAPGKFRFILLRFQVVNSVRYACLESFGGAHIPIYRSSTSFCDFFFRAKR